VDLGNLFSDPDIRYANDTLTFKVSGQKNIQADLHHSVLTLTPARDWNGEETIRFRATDKSGSTQEIKVLCAVRQVPDAPYFCETEMEIIKGSDKLTISEASGTAGPLTELKLSAVVKDPDSIMGASDPYSCQWWVNDSKGNVLYKSAKFDKVDSYTFTCQWCDEWSSRFSPYEVKCVAKDSFDLTATYTWNVTVVNVNRPPTIRITDPSDNKSFSKDKLINFDAWNSSDPDESANNLTFIWDCAGKGVLRQGQGLDGARFGKKDLKVGKYLITLTVKDSDGGQATQTFTVKVAEPKVTSSPGFGPAGLAIAMMITGILLRKRWR